jgi:hypothetical protein
MAEDKITDIIRGAVQSIPKDASAPNNQQIDVSMIAMIAIIAIAAVAIVAIVLRT